MDMITSDLMKDAQVLFVLQDVKYVLFWLFSFPILAHL